MTLLDRFRELELCVWRPRLLRKAASGVTHRDVPDAGRLKALAPGPEDERWLSDLAGGTDLRRPSVFWGTFERSC